MSELVAEGRVGAVIHRHTGGLIPVGGIVGPTSALGAAGVLLCGDAAGLTNPITGAGINAAVISGRLAGEAAASCVAGRVDALDDYREEIEDVFGPSLALALKRRSRLLKTYARSRSCPTRRICAAAGSRIRTIGETIARPTACP